MVAARVEVTWRDQWSSCAATPRPDLISTADLTHRASGAHEVDLVDLMARPLGADGTLDDDRDLVVVAPRRRASRRSDSSVANRQVRNWPSAVSLTRSHAPQNGFVTDGITPTVPRPSRYRHRSAGAAPRAGSCSSGNTALMAATISSCPTTVDFGPPAAGIERHELDEAHLDTLLASERGQVDKLVVVHTPLDHGIDLHRIESGLDRSADAVEHLGEASRRVISTNLTGRSCRG